MDPPSDSPDSVHSIILVGGQGSRLGGVDKAGLRLDGPDRPPLIDRVLDAVSSVTIGECVVVGQSRAAIEVVQQRQRDGARHLRHVVEEPPGGGPLAGVAAGFTVLPQDYDGFVVLVACDLPHLDADTCASLVTALRSNPESAVALAVDDAGREQYLLCVWRTAALSDRLAGLSPLRDGSVRHLFRDAETTRVPTGDRTGDIDNWIDVAGLGPVDVDQLAVVIADQIQPLPAHRAPSWSAAGVLAAPLKAAQAQPGFPVSAMDGFAVAGPGPWHLLSGTRPAGQHSELHLSSGEAITIATGALAPPGTDLVIRYEHATCVDGFVYPLPEAASRSDLRPIGEDWPAGAELAAAGVFVDPALRSVAVAAGAMDLLVRGPVTARVVTTGDEVLPATHFGEVPTGFIRDTVGPVMPGVLAAAGCEVSSPIGHVPDECAALATLLQNPGADIVVLVGATGRGPADLLRPALDQVGARVIVDGVRMRPGGSQLVARLPHGSLLLGLPGNPLAAISAATLTGRLLADILMSRSSSLERSRIPGVAQCAAPGRTRMVPARRDEAGQWILAPQVRTSHLLDLVGHRYFAVIPPGARDDTAVKVLRWS